MVLFAVFLEYLFPGNIKYYATFATQAMMIYLSYLVFTSETGVKAGEMAYRCLFVDILQVSNNY